MAEESEFELSVPISELSDDKHHVRVCDRQTNLLCTYLGTINEYAIFFMLGPARNPVN